MDQVIRSKRNVVDRYSAAEIRGQAGFIREVHTMNVDCCCCALEAYQRTHVGDGRRRESRGAIVNSEQVIACAGRRALLIPLPRPYRSLRLSPARLFTAGQTNRLIAT